MNNRIPTEGFSVSDKHPLYDGCDCSDATEHARKISNPWVLIEDLRAERNQLISALESREKELLALRAESK